MTSFPIEAVRAQFPALSATDDGRARIYFDNPAGTQVPLGVVERMRAAMLESNANLGGAFVTSKRAGALVDEAHAAAAMFYNAASPREIVFGQSMTALTLHISRCHAHDWRAGDEIVLSRMDHDANVAPWLLAAADRGLVVRWLDFDTDSYEFPEDALDGLLGERTRLVAVGYASNCTGTINDVKGLCAKARAAGALTYVDAVQFAPHGVVDVADLGCDFLVSSAYKFFGPHAGILYGREAVLERLFAYQVRPALDGLPKRFELGTGQREAMAGALGAIEYLASLGGEGGDGRARLTSGMARMAAWERSLTGRLIAGLKEMPEVRIRGIASDNALHRRVPTVSITVDGRHPDELAAGLAEDNVFVWSGHNYAIEPIARMGLADQGGVLRIGLAHYNTPAEVDTMLARLRQLV